MLATRPRVPERHTAGPSRTLLRFHSQRLGLKEPPQDGPPSYLAVSPLPGALGPSLGKLGAPVGGRRSSP